jgi:hypothetical protein
MLLAKEFGVPIREMPLPRQRMTKQGVFGLHSRGLTIGSESERNRHIYFASGTDFWATLNGSEEIGGFSHESEHDLALMVSDFLENGSSGTDSRCSSDSDNGLSDLAHHADKISVSIYYCYIIYGFYFSSYYYANFYILLSMHFGVCGLLCECMFMKRLHKQTSN